MLLTNAIHDSLPYIDPEPSARERQAALSAIAAELGVRPSEEHPSVPPNASPYLSSIAEAELQRISQKQALNSVELSRYEALDPPTSSASETSLASVIQWRQALQNAYISQSYLNGRQENLAQLDKYGKNAWLIGNFQLEDLLRQLEQELAETKSQIDVVNIARKNAQDEVRGEIEGLDETWKRGVGRVLDTEVATEGLRREILQSRRDGAI